MPTRFPIIQYTLRGHRPQVPWLLIDEAPGKCPDLPQTKPGPEQLLHDAVNPVVFHELHQASRGFHEGDCVLVPVLVNAVRSQVLPSEVVGFTDNLADLRRVEGLLEQEESERAEVLNLVCGEHRDYPSPAARRRAAQC